MRATTTSTNVRLRRLAAVAFGTALALTSWLALGSRPASAKVVSDNGFRPSINGFRFENYGDEPLAANNDKPAANLGPVELARLFGTGVCQAPAKFNSVTGCLLTPAAARWMEAENKDMSGGHCAGFAVLTQLLYENKYAPLKNKFAPFGVPAPFSLALTYSQNGQPALQRGIAYGFEFQMLDSVNEKLITGTPRQILKTLEASLNAGSADYSLSIRKRDGSDGHRVTPYAIDQLAPNKFDVLLYDNNYPGVTRRLRIDTKTDTWSYNGATNPKEKADLYEGDGPVTSKNKTFRLSPSAPGLRVQPCPFCQIDAGKDSSLAGAYNQIVLAGNAADHAHLMIADAEGRSVGYVDGRPVNQIPGAKVVAIDAGGSTPGENNQGSGETTASTVHSASGVDASASSAGRPNQPWAENTEPLYRVPAGDSIKITIDGRSLRHADTEQLSVVGPFYELGVDRIEIRPGEHDVVTLPAGGSSFTYGTSSGQRKAPSFDLGVDEHPTSYALSVVPRQLHGAQALSFTLGPDALRFSSSEAQTFGIVLRRDDAGGQQVLTVPADIQLGAGEIGSFDYVRVPAHGGETAITLSGHGGSKDAYYPVRQGQEPWS